MTSKAKRMFEATGLALVGVTLLIAWLICYKIGDDYGPADLLGPATVLFWLSTVSLPVVFALLVQRLVSS